MSDILARIDKLKADRNAREAVSATTSKNTHQGAPAHPISHIASTNRTPILNISTAPKPPETPKVALAAHPVSGGSSANPLPSKPLLNTNSVVAFSMPQ